MCIERDNNNKTSTWYCKPAYTGLVLNFHAIATNRYKRSVIEVVVFRIYKTCSSWEIFHKSLTKAKEILERSQYPSGFYDPINSLTVEKIITSDNVNETTSTNTSPQPKVNLVLRYRGVPTENLIKACVCYFLKIHYTSDLIT